MRIRTIAMTCAALLVAAGIIGGCGDDSSSDSSTKSSSKSASKSETTASDEHDSMSAEEMKAHEEKAAETKADAAESDVDAEFQVAVVKGAVTGGPQAFKVKKGDTVRLVVTSDTADEVHVHGVDIERAIPAGGRATFTFSPDAQGSFEVEMHDTGALLGTLEVR